MHINVLRSIITIVIIGNFIDTAELYPVPPKAEYSGRTEEIIGSWLEKHPGMREKLIIATKVAGPGRPFINEMRYKALGIAPPAGEIPPSSFSPSQIRLALSASLKRMKTSYVDLYQLHWPDRPVPLWGSASFTKDQKEKWLAGSAMKFQSKELDEAVICLGELIKEGKIKAWGLSNETSYGVMMFCEACLRLKVPLPASIQNDFGLLDRRFEDSLAETCSFFNVSLLSYGSLNGGALSGKYLDRVCNESESKRLNVESLKKARTANSRHEKTPEFQPRYHAPRSLHAVAKYQELAQKHNLSLVQLSYAWALSRYYMGSVIIGTTSVEHVIEDCNAATVTLSDEVLKDIDNIHNELPNPNAKVQ